MRLSKRLDVPNLKPNKTKKNAKKLDAKNGSEKIAKVRVAGSNPVIRSKKPPFGAVFAFYCLFSVA
jgi:hypothetical protein